MGSRRKANFEGMQDPAYPRDPGHESRLALFDPILASSLSAAQLAVVRAMGLETPASEWQPRDPDMAFKAFGFGHAPASGHESADAAAL